MNLVGPDGKAVWVDDAWVAKAKTEGFRDATPEDVARAKAGEQPALAAIEGASRTITPGLTDPFLEGFYGTLGQRPDVAKLRKEENPMAEGAGELAGTLAPFGAPAAIAEVGAGAKALGGASKVAARALQGGAETGLYGLSNGINELSMGDPKLTADHVAAETIAATLAGAGVNVVLGKFGDIGKSALVKAFGGRALKETLDDAAEKAFGRAIGVTAADMGKKSTRKNFSEIMRFGVDEGMAKAEGVLPPNQAAVAERASARAERAWNEMDSQLAGADTLGHYDAGKTATAMQTELDKLEHDPAMKSIKDRLQSFVNNFTDPAEAPRTFREAHTTASNTLKQVGEGEPKGVKDVLFKLRGALQDDMHDQVSALDPKLAEDFKRSTRDYYLANRIGEIARRGAERSEAKGASMYDLLGGLAGGGAAHAAFGSVLGGPLGGLAAAGATHLARERGGFALTSALDAMAKSGTLNSVMNGFQRHINAQLQLNPAFGGRFRPLIEDAAAKGADALLEYHLQNFQDPNYRAAVHIEPEPADTISDHADRAHRFGMLANTVKGSLGEIDKTYGRMLGTQPGRAPAAPERREPTLVEYNQIMAKLRLLASSRHPSVSPSLTQLAPQTAGTAAMQISTAAQYLISHAPQNPFAGQPAALAQPWAPAKSEMRSWLRTVDAVADPIGTLDDMRRGDLAPDTVAAVKQIYPTLFKEFQTRLLDKVSNETEPVSRKLRGQINVVLGNLDDPQVTQLIQASHKKTNPPAGPPPSDKRQKIDVEKNLATQAQRMEDKS